MSASISKIRTENGGLFLSSGAATSTAAKRVYDNLRQRIVSLDLPPGTTLSRVELVKEYEVSQSPIREAMQRLEQDGLIRIYPQSRTVVTKIDIAQLYEAHFLRVAVETEVMRRLAQSADPAVLSKARTILTMQEALVGRIDEAEMFDELDEAFHRTLFAGIGQLNLHIMLKAKAGHLARARRLDLPKEGKMRAIMTEHNAILNAIETGDMLAAQEAVRTHLAGTVGRIEILQRENPDYFKPVA
jgi:DNA-binding GntR family transcriptional regulator